MYYYYFSFSLYTELVSLSALDTINTVFVFFLTLPRQRLLLSDCSALVGYQ